MDFANILFGGRCNRACPFCIGRQLPENLQQNNLDLYPLLGQERFVAEVLRRGILQIVFTGTVTDPQLYRHEELLLCELRRQLPGRQFSLHSNGVLALKKMDVVNQYDKVCLSFPAFEKEAYRAMMGSSQVPRLEEIARQIRVPLKISCILTEDNLAGLPAYLDRLVEIGLERLVLRRLLGETRTFPLPAGLVGVGQYRGNPVYQWGPLEVTYWNFDTTESTSLNLFPDGTLSPHYLLTRAS